MHVLICGEHRPKGVGCDQQNLLTKTSGTVVSIWADIQCFYSPEPSLTIPGKELSVLMHFNYELQQQGYGAHTGAPL